MINAVVLTHNNEDTIGKTLDSISWCDEIIIIDDNSEDQMKKVARKYTSEIFTHPLHDDFAQQRNFGLSKAAGEWVLFIDSDEVVTQELKKEILSTISSNKHPIEQNHFVGYFLKRTDYFMGKELKHGETANVRLLRLAIKNSGKWIRPVHEVWDIKGQTGIIKHPILHYPHPNVAQFLDKINMYSTRNAKYLFDQGKSSNWWQILGYPAAKFFLNYIWRLGFLDGTAGAVYALMMSFHSFLSRAKLYVLTPVPESPTFQHKDE